GFSADERTVHSSHAAACLSQLSNGSNTERPFQSKEWYNSVSFAYGDLMIARLVLVLIASQPAISQTMFHGNLAHTGVYDSTGPAKFNGVKWTFHTGAAIVASPAIADGVVYIPSMDGHLYAIDQETGKEKWNFKSSMPI